MRSCDAKAVSRGYQRRCDAVRAGLGAGGTIHRAVVDVSGEPFIDLAAEVRLAFMRD